MTGEFAIAVHALVYLNHKQKWLSSEALAENVCTNPARIRKIMAKLKKAGFVITKEGLEGGYYFNEDPEKLTLRQIGEAVGAEYVSATWKSGNKEMECMVASGMSGIMDQIYEKLNELCKTHLNEITIKQIDDKIFYKGY